MLDILNTWSYLQLIQTDLGASSIKFNANVTIIISSDRLYYLHSIGYFTYICSKICFLKIVLIWFFFSDFPKAVKRLLKNDILMFRTASSVLHILPIAGLYTFLPKYLESQFRLAAHTANMISGKRFFCRFFLLFLGKKWCLYWLKYPNPSIGGYAPPV